MIDLNKMSDSVAFRLWREFQYTWLELEDFRAMAKAATWLLSTRMDDIPSMYVRRNMVDSLRRLFGTKFQKLSPFMKDPNDFDLLDGAEGDLDDVDERDMCSWLLDGLNDKERRIVYGLFWEGMNQQQIGDDLGITQEGVSWLWLHRILPKLKRRCLKAGIDVA